jgi:hypothetical protein
VATNYAVGDNVGSHNCICGMPCSPLWHTGDVQCVVVGPLLGGAHRVDRVVTLSSLVLLLGSCFGTPKVSHEEAASAKVVSKRWPKVPFHGASAF